MQDIWETDLDERGKHLLRQYDRALPQPGLNRPLGAVYGLFGAMLLLIALGAAVDGHFLNWRYPVIVAVSGLSGYLVGAYAERRDDAHRAAVLAALHWGGGGSAL